MRILLVEDEAIVRFYLKTTLSNINGEVVDAKNADGALKILENDSNFDLIITDIKMKGIDGFDLIEEIDAMGLKNINIIVESAYLDDDPRMSKYRDRVRAFVKKPIDLNVLESLVRQVEDDISRH